MTSDLRTFLSAAEQEGLLVRVTGEVDPLKNLAALCDEADRAVLFEKVAGYPEWRVAANLAVNRRMESLILGVERDHVVHALAEGIDRGPGRRRMVGDGPVKERIWQGDEANVGKLPLAIHSELDGGPYIGAGFGVVVDPETGLHNTTFPRFQLGDGRTCPLFIYSPHVTRILGKYAERGQPMPMALVLGHHPMWEIAAASSTHHPRWGELDLVSSLLGEDTEFVRCNTIDVDVPAAAEIVIEGHVLIGTVQDEGPFGNYLGTYASGPMAKAGVQKAPVFSVSCITSRGDAIYRHIQSTVWTDHQRLFTLPIEATLLTALVEMGLDVHDIYIPPWGGCGLTVIQMTPHAPGEARDALLKAALWENTTLGPLSQVALAVNRDVNIYDARDLIWALTIRTNWDRDFTAIPGTRSSPLFPVADRIPGTLYRVGSKALIDATHLPPRDDSEWWDYSRVWPMGKDTVTLADMANGYAPTPLTQERTVGPDAIPEEYWQATAARRGATTA